MNRIGRIARPNADTLLSRKFASPSEVATLTYPTVAPGTKSIDIPGYGIYKDIELVETLTSREFS